MKLNKRQDLKDPWATKNYNELKLILGFKSIFAC